MSALYDRAAMSKWEQQRAKFQRFDAFAREHEHCEPPPTETTYDDGLVVVRCPRCGIQVSDHFDPGDIAPPPVL